ncbi:uncharacterized protein [Dysidea avara]|uniref:uncharacterized protein n=1 Tax=Dysidea avara TaxID=196820 RepID=UPI00332618AA
MDELESDLDAEIHKLSARASSIATNDTSDEDFELNEGFSCGHEEMLLSKIRQLEAEIADLSGQVDQINNADILTAAENKLHREVQRIGANNSRKEPPQNPQLKKLVKLNAALTGIKFINYDWEVVSRSDRNVCRRYSYDGKAGGMSFNITFEVGVTQLQEMEEDAKVQNVQVTLNENASDEIKYYIKRCKNDISAIFAELSQYSMVNRQ